METILSRVRRVDFSILDEESLLKGLNNRYRVLEPDHLKRVTELSMGRIAKAIKLVENKEIMEAYENVYQQIRGFLKKRDISEAFAFISQIHTDTLLTQIFLEIGAVVLREDLKVAVKSDNQEKKRQVLARIEYLFETRKLSDTNVNNRLLLENFILSL